MKHYNKMARQAGMTLIELTVVLLVLIGLAGLLIPYVSGFVGKTHDSTGTNNLAALNGNFARFENEYMRQPDNMESLIIAADAAATTTNTCSGATAGDVNCLLMNTDFFAPLPLTAIHVQSLSAVGLTSVLDNDADSTNATFESVTGAPRTLAVAGLVTRVADVTANAMMGTPALTESAHLAAAFGGQAEEWDSEDGTFDGLDNCNAYVAFGVGDDSELVGRTMQSAPIHFAQRGDMGPAVRYNRFIAVYKVNSSNTAPCSTSTTAAKYVGSTMSMMAGAGHLWGVGHSAGHAYENLAAN